MKRLSRACFVASIFAIGALVAIGFFGGLFSARSDAERSNFPLILKEVRDLGDLHLVAHECEHVMEHETHRDAQSWAEKVPGVTDLVAASTRNRGLVTVRGTVEAGIDLRQTYSEVRGEQLVLFVPEPVIYHPNVEARAHSHKRGIFWRDNNFLADAETTAGKTFVAASEQKGILTSARLRAEEMVQSLVKSIGGNEVVVEFYRPVTAS